MKYERFHEVAEELVNRGRRFDSESLKRLRYDDLYLAGIGNAGAAICPDWSIIEAEQKRRLDAVKGMTLEQIVDDIKKWEKLDDWGMVYALLQEKAEARGKYKLAKAPKWRLLVYFMHALRGDWSGGRDSEYLAKIYELIPEVEKEGIVPLGWVRAVKNNADTYDGQYCDGRIMRDGQLYLDPEIGKQFGIPSASVSGNLAKLIGARAVTQGGYLGSYDELFQAILTPDQMVDYMRKIEGLSDED